RLDFSSGVPAEYRTIVAVPTLLTTPEAVEKLIETIEVHYLANRDPHFHFALLTDFPDADSEHMPTDEALLQQVKAGLNLLAERYRQDRSDIFFLFHRPRHWN